MFLFLFLYEISFIQAYKYLSVKTGMEARKSALLSMCLMFFGGFVFLLPAMVSRFLFSEQVNAMTTMQNPAEAAYAIAAMQVLPNGFLGILVVAMFAATMSGMDTALNEAAGQIVNNLWPALGRNLKIAPLSERATLRACKVVTAGLGVLIIAFALMFATDAQIDLFGSFALLSSVIVFPMTLPLVFSIFSKKLPRWSYFFIAGCAIIPSVLAEADKRLNNRPWDYQDKILWILACASGAAVICRAFYWTSSEEYRRRVDALFSRMRTPIEFEEEVTENRDAFQLNLMGNASLIAGGLLSLLLLVPNSMGGRVCVVFLFGSITLVGSLLKVAARRAEANDTDTTRG
jgi:hypothetical protein